MKKLSLIYLLYLLPGISFAQPGISTPVPSVKPGKDQMEHKYGMFIHFDINVFTDVE
ncbi:hypothetical protein [Mucilaginibacter sp. OK098]|uniref:hypothetical protein n=1 Tax=Mucilaginibacter sp. OK098 TaxID=1855297 RepID=UPI0013562D5D|nr:hypothetical protein [Mucilaginibacter sp. OK098]